MAGHRIIQLRRGKTKACMQYPGMQDEIVLDIDLWRVRLYPENRLLDKGELASIYIENGYRLYLDFNHSLFVKPHPDQTLRFKLCHATRAAADAYTGSEGELIFVEDEKSIYVCDGRTPGGILL